MGGDFKAVQAGTMRDDPQHFELSGDVSVDEMRKRFESGQDVYTGGLSDWRPPWGHPLRPGR